MCISWNKSGRKTGGGRGERKKERKIGERKKKNNRKCTRSSLSNNDRLTEKIIYKIYSMEFAFVRDLYLKTNNRNLSPKFLHFHEYPKLSNILTWNSLNHNTPSPTHIPIKLATPPLKFHLPRPHNHPHATTTTVPSSCIAPPNNRRGNKETLQTFAPTLPNICLANKVETNEEWNDSSLRKMDKDDRSRRYRAQSRPESSSRPSSTLIAAHAFHVYPYPMWFSFSLFKQPATN